MPRGEHGGGYGRDDNTAAVAAGRPPPARRATRRTGGRQISALINKQSRELDPKKRRAIVADILKMLEQQAARPVVAWRLDYFAYWPYVKGLLAHHSIYNFGRIQDLWLGQ